MADTINPFARFFSKTHVPTTANPVIPRPDSTSPTFNGYTQIPADAQASYFNTLNNHPGAEDLPTPASMESKRLSGSQPLPADDRKRKRARKACVPCSSRKRKCDGNYPCKSCDGYGYECHYRESEAPSASSDHLKRQSRHPSSPSNAHGTSPGESRPWHSSRSQSSKTDHGYLEPSRSRYMGQHASISFARSLGLELQSDNLPRLHSFGWNLGIRDKGTATPRNTLSSILTFDDLCTYSNVFWDVISPVYNFMQKDHFMRRCTELYGEKRPGIAFEALAAAIVACGSLYSSSGPLPQEDAVITHCQKLCEDQENVLAPSVDYAAALLVWCFYLRTTQKPHACWIVNCTAVHVAEAVGLHKDPVAASKAMGVEVSLTSEEILMRSRLFWLIKSKNTILSFELGRTPARVDGINCKYPYTSPGESPTAAFFELANLLPKSVDTENWEEYRHEMGVSLARINEIPIDFPVITLTAADTAFCIYRRLRALGERLTQEEHKNLLKLGETSLSKARELVQLKQPWFQLVNTTFQFICILISMDSPDSITLLRPSLSTLEHVVVHFHTERTTEALATARMLIRALKRKKRKELELLEDCEPDGETLSSEHSGDDMVLDFSFDGGLPFVWDDTIDMNLCNLTAPEIG